MKGKVVNLFIIIILLLATNFVTSANYINSEDCNCPNLIIDNDEIISENHKYSLGLLVSPIDDTGLSEPVNITGDPPISWDWRDVNGKNWVTPIKDQGNCGSCYAFAAIAAMETVYNIQKNDSTIDIDLSEQFLISCGMGFPWINQGCCGGFTSETLMFLKTQGVPLESCFPYGAVDANGRDIDDCLFQKPSNEPISCSNRCSDWKSQLVKVDSYQTLYSKKSIKNAISTYGPVIAGFVVYDDFIDYSSGIYEHNSGQKAGNHLVIIIGYNDTQGYWICKNSWGTSWGEDGFFRIKYGECGIDLPGSCTYIKSCIKNKIYSFPLVYQFFQIFPLLESVLKKFMIH
jgi:C1A family cysteine protease